MHPNFRGIATWKKVIQEAQDGVDLKPKASHMWQQSTCNAGCMAQMGSVALCYVAMFWLKLRRGVRELLTKLRPSSGEPK